MKALSSCFIGKRQNSRLGKAGQAILGIALGCAGVTMAVAGQSVTGKIIIDGIVYGEGSSKIIEGSGVPSRERRHVNDFHAVEIKTGVDVNFTRSDDTDVELSGDDNLLKLIRTDVSRGVLTISSTESYQTKSPLTVSLTGPHLSSIAMHGAGDIKLADLKENDLSLQLNGSGDVSATGSVGQLNVLLNGSSDVEAEELLSENANIQILGSGDIAVNAKQSLDVSIIGSGNVKYYGHPEKINRQIIGSGEVEAGE
jgi:carbon monoxide dehydrogenase subunit G